MLKEFVEHIQRTAQPLLQEVCGSVFTIRTDGDYQEIELLFYSPCEIKVSSLEALVKMVLHEGREYAKSVKSPVFIHVPDHMTVSVFLSPDKTKRFRREFLYCAAATDVPGWDSKVQLPFEEMQIALRTRFQETVDTAYVQKLLSDISTGAKITYNDNGVATTIVTSKGVALQGSETIRPIVKLKPYRTFQEVDQPESTFLIRVNERGISFTEADGGMWKLQARQTIKAYLEERLADLDDIIIAL